MKFDQVICSKCEDVVARIDGVYERKLWHCKECYKELKHGKIPNVTGQQFQSLASHLTPRQAAKLN